MNVHEKRMLLEAIEILVKRPAQANEETLGIAIRYFSKLVSDVTNEQIIIAPVSEHKQDKVDVIKIHDRGD